MLRQAQTKLQGAFDYATAPTQSETTKMAVITGVALTYGLCELIKDGVNLELLGPCMVLLLSGGSLVRKEGAGALVFSAMETSMSLYKQGVTFYNNFRKPAVPAGEVHDAPVMKKTS